MSRIDGADSPRVPSRAVLLLHGLGGGPYELEPLRDALSARGERFECPLYHGVGTGDDARWMPHEEWPAWERRVGATYEQMAAGGAAVDVVGFSTGCLLAIRLALRVPVSRMVLLCPFLRVRTRAYEPCSAELLTWTVGRALEWVPRRRPAVSDALLRAELERRMTYRWFSMPAARSALDLIRRVSAEAGDVKVPTRIVSALEDTVVDPEGARELGRKIKGSELRELSPSDHLVLWDQRGPEAIEGTLEFLGRAVRE